MNSEQPDMTANTSATPFHWPEDARAAVSLRFDDGLDSQLHCAVPLLNEHGLTGSFYICPAGTEAQWLARAEAWSPLIDAGHEIGNHTLSHPIPLALADEPHEHCYERMTLGQYEADVLEAHRRLELAFGPREWTFCYPCYQTAVGIGVDRCSVVPIVAKHFLAASVGAEISKPFNDPRYCDLHALLAVATDKSPVEHWQQLIEQCIERQQWLILVFHGVDGDYLSCSREDFTTLLRFLDERRNEVWTAPIARVASHIRKQRND